MATEWTSWLENQLVEAILAGTHNLKIYAKI